LERKDRSYYLINSKKGIELPTNNRVFHKKGQNSLIFDGQAVKIGRFSKKWYRNIKKAKRTFFHHLQ
jgi:hypothetical protein